jgi:DNA ligase 1
MELLKVAEIIESVGATSGKKDKKGILSLHKDNTLLGEVLNLIFNPFLKTNIAKKKLAKKVDKDLGIEIKDIHEYMDYLIRSSGKDEHIATVQKFINSQPKDIAWLLEAMATKTLKIGATSSTINKAFGKGFIPTFDLMLAEKWVETKKVKGIPKVYEHWQRYIGKEIIATKKLDGNRVAVFVRDDKSVKLYSREGHVLEGFVEIEEAFSEFPVGQVYDGELIATNEEGLNSKDLFQKTSKIVKKKGIKKGLEFHAFDILPIKDFELGGFEVSCLRRKEMLAKVVDMMNHPLVQYVAPLYIGELDKEIIDAISEEAKANGDEGIMVQLADAPYSCKRTYDILKVKSFESADIRCLDIYEGKSGKNIGRLGGLVCDFKGHRVNIGGGFSDELRDSIWENPSLVIGKIIEIQYFEEFEDENGELDLRFAGFKTIRDDKTEPSYY